MTTLPIPFVVAFLLLVLAGANHHALKQSATGRVFERVLYLNALGMVLVGIRWTWDVVAVLPVMAMLSVVSSALLYLAFQSLGQPGQVIRYSRDWPHAIPCVLIAVSLLFAPYWIEVWLILIKLVYAVLFIRLTWQYPDSLQLVRLSWLNNSRHALWAVAILHVFSLTVDIAITLDFLLFNGRHAADLIGFINLIILALLGYAVVVAGRGRVLVPVENKESEGTTEPAAAENNDAVALLKELNHRLIDDRLYADSDLSLQRFARKTGVPARTISRTVNAQTGQNISQWVNQARINAVCELLKNTDLTIIEAMQEAGFVTKSNFNREFRRITGKSPSEWREQHTGG